MKPIKFNPTKADLELLVESVEKIKIKDIDDQDNYNKAKDLKKTIAKFRKAIKDRGLELRRESIDYRNQVIKEEKELLAILEPKELELKESIESIDNARKRSERAILMPMRRQMVEDVNGNLTDNEILAMDEQEFAKYHYDMKELREQEAEDKRLEKEREKTRKAELVEAGKQAKLRERERLAGVEARRKERAKLESEEKARIEKEDKDKLEKNKVFQKFLKDNNFEGESDILKQTETEVRIYRLVNTLKK